MYASDAHTLPLATSDCSGLFVIYATVQILDCLSDDQCLRVLREQSSAHESNHLHKHLHTLPEQQHRLALLAHYSTIESSKSLAVALTDPQTSSLIASCLPSFTALTSLSFRPWLPDQSVRQAFTHLRTLQHLESLDLSGMHLTEAASKAVRDTLPSMPQLTSLNLSDCSLTCKTIRTVLPAICELPSLLQLSLRNNELFYEGTVVLAEHLPKMHRLKSLDIAEVHLCCCLNPQSQFPKMIDSGPTLKELQSEILVQRLAHLVSLEQLDICGNVGGPAQNCVARAVSKLPNFQKLLADEYSYVVCAGYRPAELNVPSGGGLQDLVLITTQCMHTLVVCFATPKMAQCPANLRELTRGTVHPAPHITALKLSIKQLRSQAQEIAEELSALSNIADLSVEVDTTVSGGEVLPIVSGLSNLTQLTSVSWVHRRAAADDTWCTYAQQLADACVQLPSLQSLHVNTHRFYAEPSNALLRSLIALPSLSKLSISNLENGLVSSLAPHLPASLVNLSLEIPVQPLQGPFDNAAVFVHNIWTNLTHLTNLQQLQMEASLTSMVAVLCLAELLTQLCSLSCLSLKLRGCDDAEETVVKRLYECASMFCYCV